MVVARIPACAAALLLAACATDTTVYYAPPPGLAPQNAVAVLGSKKSHFLQSSEYVLVWQVDGQRVRDSATHWDRPLLVTAGAPHRLSVAYGWGGISGSTDIDFTGSPGSTVVVEGEAVDPDKLARLWLADAATGAVIGARQQVALSWLPSPPLPLDTDQIAIRALDRNLAR